MVAELPRHVAPEGETYFNDGKPSPAVRAVFMKFTLLWLLSDFTIFEPECQILYFKIVSNFTQQITAGDYHLMQFG